MVYTHCNGCGKLFDKTASKCHRCDHVNERLIPKNMSSYISIFKSELYEHIADKPIMITSKRQLREETRRRGQVSPYAE